MESKEYYKKHREHIIEKSKEYYRNHKEQNNRNQRISYWRKKNQGLQHLKIDGKVQWVKERPKVYCSICEKEIENVKHGNTKHCKECNKEINRKRSRIRYQYLKNKE